MTIASEYDYFTDVLRVDDKTVGFVCLAPAGEDLIFHLKVDVPADRLPKGNLIQQYPKSFLAFSAATLSSLLYLKFKQ